VVAGTDLVAVGASADGLSADGTAHALRVTVGDRAVAAGAVLDGGAIAVHYDGADAVTVSAASVVVNRCHLVDSASSAASARRMADPAAPIQPRSTLPATGATPELLAAAATLLLAVGLVARRLTRPARPARPA
jgi:hypothetical protein